MPTETVLESNDIETVAPARVGDTLGYARVSTHDQNPDAQSDRLIEAGAIRVFTGIVSGKRFDRPGLAELIDHARPGDRLCIIRLDRLGRSLRELLETVDGLKARGIHLISLEERLDTSSAAGELVFHVFGAIAHFERRLISERTRDGIAAARKRGRTPGRPPLDPDTVSAAQKLIEAGLSPARTAKQLGIGRATAYRIAKALR
jgi:DNA invertase Pin-like site-specific DNA recombinase